MNDLYLTPTEQLLITLLALGLVLTALGAFSVGYLLGRRSEKQDNAYNPPLHLRPDNYYRRNRL